MAKYDKESLTYDDWYGNPMGKFIDDLQTKLVFEQLNPAAGMKVLDVGCGTGNFSVKLAKMGCKVVGIDISEGMLTKAKSKASGLSVEFYTMNAANLSFENDSFDAVISVTAFEFIENGQGAFNEMMRVAKTGAPVVVGTLNKSSSWGTLYESEEMRQKSIFKYAKLKSKDDLQSYNPDRLISIGECLHVNPTFVETDFTLENENKLKTLNPGGFICGLWKK